VSAPKKAPRGKCPVCGFSFRLKKNGQVQSHWLYCGSERVYRCPDETLERWGLRTEAA